MQSLYTIATIHRFTGLWTNHCNWYNCLNCASWSLITLADALEPFQHLNFGSTSASEFCNGLYKLHPSSVASLQPCSSAIADKWRTPHIPNMIPMPRQPIHFPPKSSRTSVWATQFWPKLLLSAHFCLGASILTLLTVCDWGD